MSIASFLPLERMHSIQTVSATQFGNGVPFPHVVLDDFFDPGLLEQVLAEFPSPGEIAWHRFDNEREIKLASGVESSFGPTTRLLLYHLNSFTFLEFLSRVTGIADLIPDPGFDGGGMHQIVRGGKLGIHADFNKHPRYGLDRRLNVLIYLNKDWREEYGGYLQLWNREMTRCEAKILPVFNRMVIFGTTDFTYHGHPEPLQCPEGVTRKSLALYYFSNGRPAEEVSGEHSTLFRTPAGQAVPLPVRLRAWAEDFVPPVMMRRLSRLW